MTISEMHIAIDNELQTTNSAGFNGFSPDQKDFYLNRAMFTYINTRLPRRGVTKGEGHEDNQKRLDDLSDLVVRRTVPAYKYDANSVFAVMPENYLHLYSDVSQLAYDCTGIAKTEVSTDRYTATVEFKDASTSDLMNEFKIVLDNGGSVTLYDVTDYPAPAFHK